MTPLERSEVTELTEPRLLVQGGRNLSLPKETYNLSLINHQVLINVYFSQILPLPSICHLCGKLSAQTDDS